MKPFQLTILLVCCVAFLARGQGEDTSIETVNIVWVDSLEGDFSFTEEWSYPLSVYKNQFGQLSCDGICPMEIDRMKDEQGKIYEDSLEAFYEIVDTTHQYHSLQSEAWTYEWDGTDYIDFTRDADDSLLGQSACNIATHSSLVIKIKGDTCTAWIDFNSITDIGRHIFPMESGSITIDRSYFERGIVKASFDFSFANTLEPERKMYWKGLIFSEVEEE